jgi:UDP-N-acetylmuramyl pentapeptide phosphotransferase/UDP-N-acetylglucosamine-1-phosphate transferase
MTIAEKVRRPLGTALAAGVVVFYAVAMSAATWVFLNTGSQILPGVLVWIGWGLYPGLAAYIAIRARSELLVTAIAMLVPSLLVALSLDSGRVAMGRFIPSLAIAAGVFVGIWVGSALMRRSWRGRTLVGFVLGGIVGGTVTILTSLPMLLLQGTGRPG